MSAMKQLLTPRLVSVARRQGDVIYDPIRQPKLHEHQIEQGRQQAEDTNAVFRQAIEKRPAVRTPATKARCRFWLRRALAAVAMMWGVVAR